MDLKLCEQDVPCHVPNAAEGLVSTAHTHSHTHTHTHTHDRMNLKLVLRQPETCAVREVMVQPLFDECE